MKGFWQLWGPWIGLALLVATVWGAVELAKDQKDQRDQSAWRLAPINADFLTTNKVVQTPDGQCWVKYQTNDTKVAAAVAEYWRNPDEVLRATQASARESLGKQFARWEQIILGNE